jgi:hypothetical protein
MPKYRQLHTKIIDSFDFNEMPDDFCRVTWVLLPVILDCEGRGIDNPTWIKSKMYPLRSDVTSDKISEVFDWLAEKGMIIRYQVEGRSFFYVPTFKKYQSGTENEAKSLLPAPSGFVPANIKPTKKLLPGDSTPPVYAYDSASDSESIIESESAKTENSEKSETDVFLSKLDVWVGCPFGNPREDVDTASVMVEEFGLKRVKLCAPWAKDKGFKSMRTALRSMNTALRNGGFQDPPPNGSKPVAPASQTTDFAALADEMRM